MTDKYLLTSPVGSIVTAFLTRKTTDDYQAYKDKRPSTKEPVYLLKLAFDGVSDEDNAFREALKKVNPDIMGTKNAKTPTGFTVKATTQFDFKIQDSDGNDLSDNVPSVIGGDAAMVVVANPEKGSIKLHAVVLGKNLELYEGNTNNESISNSAIEDALARINAKS